MIKIVQSILTILIVLNLYTCANVAQLLNTMQVKEPTARVTGAKIAGVTFNDIDMVFDLEIENPNNIGVKMAGFDYKIEVNNNAFIQGDQQSTLEIAKNGKSSLPIPVKIVFTDLYNLFAGMKNQDTTTYQLSCGLTFNLPVLGNVRVPVTHNGSLPLIKMPSISLNNIQVNNIGISGADLSLNLKIKNPNSLLLNLNNLNYNLDVSGYNWVRGTSNVLNQVSPKGESILKIPVSLNFAEMGLNLFSLLTGSSNLDYRFTGDLDVGTSWDLLKDVRLSLDESGKVPLLK